MVKIDLIKSLQDIEKCFPVMGQLRTSLTKAEFVKRVQKQQKSGYLLVYVEDNGKVVSVAGFRFLEALSRGKFMYVDDLITDNEERSKGYGGKLFDWLIVYARKQGCKELRLDSGVQRFSAHRFYFRKGMVISSNHFEMTL